MNAKKFFYDFGKSIYHIDALYDDFAKDSHISPTLLWILYALNDGNSHTQREICLDWDLPKSTVNTVIMELKANGYIELVPIKGKRREMTIVLTESGKDYAKDILADLYRIEESIFHQLNENQKEVIESLETIVQYFKKEKQK
ncbi:MAG: winged helix-turn-helix transcriptional regulator [Holdemanella sp.]|nr:winged helix-turn-helix transcriptional regulator [Holdemanella sp.]